jgi:hypothetical protein
LDKKKKRDANIRTKKKPIFINQSKIWGLDRHCGAHKYGCRGDWVGKIPACEDTFGPEETLPRGRKINIDRTITCITFFNTNVFQNSSSNTRSLVMEKWDV